MDIEKIKEDLSICYLKSISTINGIALDEIRHDEDSTDVLLKKTVLIDEGRRFNSQLRVQLKCTSSTTQYSMGDCEVTYKLKVKNYNDLCLHSTTPIILCLLVLPDNNNEWVSWSESELILRGKMFWFSLAGKKQSENKGTVSIKIPFENILNNSNIESLLIRTAKGEVL